MPSTGTDYTKRENIFLPVSAAYASMRLAEGEAQNYVAVLGVPSDDDDKGSTVDDAPAVGEFNTFSYGLVATLGYDMLGVYFKYYPKTSRMLPEGSVDMNYMTIGVLFDF